MIYLHFFFIVYRRFFRLYTANGALVQPANKLVEASNGAALAKTKVGKVIDLVMMPTGGGVKDDLLWNSGLGNETWQKGSGSVRVMDPMDL